MFGVNNPNAVVPLAPEEATAARLVGARRRAELERQRAARLAAQGGEGDEEMPPASRQVCAAWGWERQRGVGGCAGARAGESVGRAKWPLWAARAPTLAAAFAAIPSLVLARGLVGPHVPHVGGRFQVL